jgi:hypothetical protein
MKTNISLKNTKVIPFPIRNAPAYPNAMARELKIHRLLDCALTLAASVGITASLLVLFTIL